MQRAWHGICEYLARHPFQIMNSNSLNRARIALLAAITALLLMTTHRSEAQSPDQPKRKVLFAVTSHNQKGSTGEPTGFYLSEVAHPWDVLVKAGYEIDFVSPKGGKAPVDGFDLADPINQKFWENQTYRHKIEHTRTPSEIVPGDYAAIHFAGGHGAMWDFPDDAQLAKIAAEVYERNGVVSAVCHGPAGLVNIQLSNGKYLVDGKKINAFTNEEEVAVKLDRVVPFLLESKLIERGALFEKSGLWQSHVVADQRVVTGQNPQSAQALGEAVLEQLRAAEVIGKITRYEVKPAHLESFRKALTGYVGQASGDEGNLLAEAYHERDQPSVLWLIERWAHRNDLDRFGRHSAAKALESLQGDALGTAVETYLVKDLAPIPKKEWRRAPRAEDQPLTVMLFVDSKPGTQDDFMATYQIALPKFRSQPGVVTYQLSRIEGEETKFVTYEKFRSPAAFQAHLDFPPIKPVLGYLQTSIRKQPFQDGLRLLVELAPASRE